MTSGRGFLLFLVHDLRSEAEEQSSEKCEMLAVARNKCVLYLGKGI